MSASREKKQRQGDGLSEKQRREAEEAQKARSKKILYTVIGIVCAVLVIALLVWNSNFFQRRTVAATVGDKQYTVGDVAFYYNNAKQTIRNYANYGLVTYNASLADDQQTIDDTTAQNLSLYVGLTAEAGQTYAQFFQDRALEALQNEALLCAAAAEDGYTLSDAGKQSVEESVTSYKQSATDYGYTLAAYLRAVYGPYMTESTFREHLTNSTLASEYAQHYQESLTYSDEELTAYYQEHADTMDTFDFRAFYISGAPAAKTDADGNTVEATDAEKAAAMGLAKTQADAMLRRLQDGEAFNAAAKDYAAEDAKANYDDPDYNRQTRLGSAVASYDYAEWLTDSARKDGDVTVVESSSGYYVLQFHGRWLDDTTHYSADIRHILVMAETGEPVQNEDGTTTTPEPTEEQYAAAKAKIESIQAEFEAGDRTADSFAKLAETYSEDPGSNTDGGFYKVTQSTSFFADFKNWCLDESRQSGDLGVIQNTQSNQWGYHLIYFQDWGPLVWKNTAQSALSSADTNAWIESRMPSYPTAAVEKGMAKVIG